MRWKGGRESSQVVDRRGMRLRGGVAIGGGGVLLIVLFALLTGTDPTQLLDVAKPSGAALRYVQCQQDFCYDLCFNP